MASVTNRKGAKAERLDALAKEILNQKIKINQRSSLPPKLKKVNLDADQEEDDFEPVTVKKQANWKIISVVTAFLLIAITLRVLMGKKKKERSKRQEKKDKKKKRQEREARKVK